MTETARLGSSGAKSFVLVHGAWHGGWCWSRVTPLLTSQGHRVLTPTCTGLGDRAHLLSRDVGLNTFIQDIAAAIETEELEDVVLVGHSFAGNMISGVADRMPERIAHLIYLDATVVRSGQSPFDVVPPDVAVARRRAAAESETGYALPVPPAAVFGVSEPDDARWLTRHMRPHPVKTFEDILHLEYPIGNGRPKTYIACTEPEFPVLAGVRRWVRDQAGWDYRELATGHDAMVTAPRLLTDLLLAIAG